MFREEPDRTGFLFDMDSGASVVLNRTGCFLWKLLEAGTPPGELPGKLAEACGGALPPSAAAETEAFLNSLRQGGWIGEQGGTVTAPPGAAAGNTSPFPAK